MGVGVFALGYNQTQPRTSFAGYLGEGELEALTIPSHGIDFERVTRDDDGIWVAYEDLNQLGDASRVLARVEDGVVTPVGTFPSSLTQLHYANDRIYVTRPVGLTASGLFARAADGHYEALCAPDASRLGRIARLDDGALFVATHDAAYIYDGTTWKRLSVAVTNAFGTRDELYGVEPGVNSAGFNGKLYRFTR